MTILFAEIVGREVACNGSAPKRPLDEGSLQVAGWAGDDDEREGGGERT
jgi:hypothetical protein